MNKGIVIIAVKHAYYGNMAYNLAVSIKAKDPSLPVAIVHDEIGIHQLTDSQKALFDISIPDNGIWHQLRARVPEITPFDKTLVLDADQVWLKDNPADVFDLLNTTNFTCVNQGYYDLDAGNDLTDPYPWGCNVADMIKQYRLTRGKLWKMRGEFILFKKSKKITDVFSKAAEYCAKPLIKIMPFAGGIPDEWAIDIALNKAGIDCHLSKWQPSYWPLTYSGRNPHLWEMNKVFETLSVGGSQYTPHQKKIYDIVMDGACYKLGIKNLLPLRPKNNYIPERKKQNAKVIIQ